ncbi:hypothetical protein [Mycobacterium ostraviense]|uniref:Uncharacterized protein n=1 Tax=Mycobacterium ostraviense TaxID=2738409 RepID=A0A163RP02_9MYCO|nr:hypothetical protein [Mycobacterium ostraviense]KZS53436.1 hypothetical protein A4G28_22310 [Mycobacterium ostraviense]UGT89865.1 hypothetical protein LTS72_15680 [Mycobacterium ostraviense]
MNAGELAVLLLLVGAFVPGVVMSSRGLPHHRLVGLQFASVAAVMALTVYCVAWQPDTALRRTPPSMYLPVAVLVLGCVAVGVVPRLTRAADAAGRRFVDPAGYVAAVVGRTVPGPATGATHSWSASGVSLAVIGVLAAGCLAMLALRRTGDGAPLRRRVSTVVRPAIAALQAAHSGHVGDYVAWMFAAVTLLGAALGLQVL